MKSNINPNQLKPKLDNIGPLHNEQISSLTALICKEKELLVSMFLTNASIAELAEQYKRIDELNLMRTSNDNS